MIVGAKTLEMVVRMSYVVRMCFREVQNNFPGIFQDLVCLLRKLIFEKVSLVDFQSYNLKLQYK